MTVSRRNIPSAVVAIIHTVDDFERRCPLRTFRLFGRLAQLQAFARHVHCIRDLLAIGGPCNVLWRVRQARHAGGGMVCHPVHEQLRLLARFAGNIGDALATWRPAGLARIAGRPGCDGSLLARPDIDQPYAAASAIGHYIARLAHISDGLAIRANLRISRDFQREEVATL